MNVKLVWDEGEHLWHLVFHNRTLGVVTESHADLSAALDALDRRNPPRRPHPAERICEMPVHDRARRRWLLTRVDHRMGAVIDTHPTASALLDAWLVTR